MEIQVSVQETAEKTTTAKITLAPGVDVCRVTVVRKTNGQRTRQVTEHVEHDPSMAAGEKYFGGFAIVEPELIEKLRLTGWFANNKDAELVSLKPFSRITKGKDKPYVLVRLDNADHRLFDVEGGRLPVAVYFDYGVGDGSVNNYSFDLKRLLEHLQKREDVTILKGRWGDALVQRVPHYNAGGMSGSEFIAFRWHPTVELFRQYIELSAKGDRFYRHHVAHTLMGNDEFRIPEPPATEISDDEDD